MKSPEPKAVLIDGNSLAYRAFYALPDTMRAASGLITNAIYGFTTMLIKILDEKPDFVAIAFDLPEPTFRHREYKEYKATRDKAPPTLHEQIPAIKEMVKAFDIPIFEAGGFEADDVIGTLAKQAEKAGHSVTIVSGDLDPLQLVDQNIKVLTTRKGITDTVLYGEKEVEARYGLKPGQLIDYKALKGDTSDNIPGVPKVGEKTATELLKEFGTLENIYGNLDKIKKPALRENLGKNRELADLSRRLGTIVTDVPLKIDFEKLKRREIDWTRVIPLFEKLEFDSLVKKYGQGVKGESIKHKRAAIANFDFRCIKTEKDFAALIAELERADVFAFDLETTSLDTFAAEIVGISFSTESKTAYYLPINHKMEPRSSFAGSIFDRLRPLFASDKLKVGHNLKYDIAVLNSAGLEVAGPLFDTMIAAYLLDPVSGKYSLKHLAKQFLGREMIKLMELIGKDAEYSDFSQVPIDLAADYAASDAEATFGLYEVFSLALKAQKLEKLFTDIEMPLLPVLTAMERSGVSVDLKLLDKLSGETESELKELERHLFSIAGEVFNLNSPKQLANILFNKLQLPIIKKTKTGPSTDFEVLETLAEQKFEIAAKLIDYRELSKLKSTYIDVLPTLINPRTGRVHASFNQAITATGRLSSSNPNLQNIPARLRAAFVPAKPGWKILAADYSQIELRVLAHLSSDPALIEAFKSGKDIHQATAEELGISRETAKTVNFGVIYGISGFGLAKQLKVKKAEAAKYIDNYFTKYQGVKKFIDETIAAARRQGYITTLLGRKRPLPDINSPNAGLRAFAERTAINTPVQGTAADMIKLAMVRIAQKFPTINCGEYAGLKSRLIIQVHDELVFECPEAEVETVKALVKTEMESAVALKIPVLVDIGVGDNWGTAE